MLHFNLLKSFFLGLYAASLFFRGDKDAVSRHGRDVEAYDYRSVFDDDDPPPPDMLN